MRSLSPALLASLNELESVRPWAWLFELTIDTVPTPWRMTTHSEPITFHTLSFQPWPMQIGAVEENSNAEIRRLQVAVGNVDQQVLALLEEYWTTARDPRWTVHLFQVDTTQPDQTSITAYDQYTVAEAVADLVTIEFSLRWEGWTLSRQLPGRRYTRTAGFPLVPKPPRAGVLI